MELFLIILNASGYFDDQPQRLEQKAELVKKICEHLWGHPLALVITAERIISRSLEEIWDGINKYPKEVLQKIDDLTGAPIGVWTALDLSYNDLSEEQKKLFQELSIFFGVVDKEAIRGILGIENTVNILEVLVRRSLVEHRDKYYYFLPIIKMYAESNLKESDEAIQSLHRQATDYFKKRRDITIVYTIDHLDFLGREYRDRLAWKEMIKFMIGIQNELFKGGYWNISEEKLYQCL